LSLFLINIEPGQVNSDTLSYLTTTEKIKALDAAIIQRKGEGISLTRSHFRIALINAWSIALDIPLLIYLDNFAQREKGFPTYDPNKDLPPKFFTKKLEEMGCYLEGGTDVKSLRRIVVTRQKELMEGIKAGTVVFKRKD
jgi:hypothetical protein